MLPATVAGASASSTAGTAALHARTPTLATITGRRSPLEKYTFYLDVKNASVSGSLRETILKLGGRVEVFLVESVTHVVTEEIAAPARARAGPSKPASASASRSQEASLKRRASNCRSRVDAMLECVEKIPQQPTLSIVQQAKNLNIPIWSVQKIKAFLNRATALACKRLNGEKILKGAYIKFEALDRKKRAIFQEFRAWPRINLNGEHSSCPFMPNELKSSSNRGTLSNKKGDGSAKQTGKGKLRMSRNRRPKEEDKKSLSKHRGFCEVCRIEYESLKTHEQSPKHIEFVKNSNNYLSLDRVISNSTDINNFFKNKPKIERKSLRNSKSSEDSESAANQSKCEVLCNGDGDTKSGCNSKYKQLNSVNAKRNSQMSPALSDGGHYLRSKGVTVTDQDCPYSTVAPKDITFKKENSLTNGALSPKLANDKHEMSTKVNGHAEDSRQSYCRKAKRPRSIRWRRPSPDSAPSIPDNQTYYKVVGMSTKLRSSNSFLPNSPKESEPSTVPTKPLYNGDSNSGLVVKFRRVRRSELSVLSDEAENFMFPKKDDSETEDELVTSSSGNRVSSSDLLTTSSDLKSKVKEEVFSGDDNSQDSCGSDTQTKRKSRRRTQSDRDVVDCPDSRAKNPKLSKSPDPQFLQEFNLTSTSMRNNRTSSNSDELLNTPEKCLRWENGSLRTSPEVESLTYTFEKVPNSESWYDAFKRQDDGKENPKSISQYLGCYLKSPILPYEMAQLPPLKPNCCILSQIKRPNFKCVPSRLYGTRGMKNRKLKLNAPISTSRNPRKSPREHASTLAILGGLIHRKRSKTSGSEDTKSLPSIVEEDVSSDANFTSKSNDTCNSIAESSKQLNELLSTVYDDIEDYDIPIEHMEQNIKLEKLSLKPNVVELLQSYETCDVLEKTVQEIQDTINGPKKRKGYKFKKKNKTGWPNKKKLKKESSSTVGSACSSREASMNREPSPDLTVLPKRRGRRKIVKSAKVLELEANDKKYPSAREINDNSIMSSDECSYDKNTTEDDDYSEGENYVPSVRTRPKRTSVTTNGTAPPRRRRYRRRANNELQPVVRVQKMNDKNVESASTQRQLRRRWNPHR